METLQILSAGAARTVVEPLVRRLLADAHARCEAGFGGVHAIRAQALQATELDVVILSSTLIDELIASRHLLADGRAGLGAVQTCLAVREGAPMPAIANAEQLRRTLLACPRLWCPDPAAASAGQAMGRVFDALGIADAMRERVFLCASGAAALEGLAHGAQASELGVAQKTEILGCPGVALAGALPGALASSVRYCAAPSARTRSPQLARRFIDLLTAEPALLRQAGFE